MQNVLIIQTAFLGDLLLSVPLLKNIRRLYPSVKIHLVCRKSLASFFLNYKLVDFAYEIEKGKASSYKSVRHELSKTHFDLLLSPHESFRTMLFSMRIRAKQKVSFRRWYQYFTYDTLVDRPMFFPEALRQLSLLTPISEEIDSNLASVKQYAKDFLEMQRSVPDWATMIIDAIAEKPVVLLAPGSVWATKMWPKEHFLAVAKHYLDKNYEVRLIGAKAELDVCNWLHDKDERLQNFCGKTSLEDLFEMMKSSCLLVSNDSGPMHMAALCGLPTVAIFGPTVLGLGYRPWQNRARVVDIDLDCRPCGKHGHKACPIGTHACMIGVKPERVIKEAELLCNEGV